MNKYQKIIALVLFLNIQFIAELQVFRGTVLDQYTNRPVAFAAIYINGTYVGITSDKNGYFDPSGIIWSGEMSKQRVGDFLPFEYSIKSKKR